MRLSKKYVLSFMLLATASQPLLAEEERVKKWKGSAELGSLWTSGNTNTSSTDAKFEIGYYATIWQAKLRLEALNSEDEGETSKEKYSGLIQIDRNFNEHSYLALVMRQERDYFGGFIYQGSASAGYGYRFLHNDVTRLSLEAGPGYRRDKVRNTNMIDDEGMIRSALKFHWFIRDGVEFTQDFIAEMGNQNSVYVSETGLKSQIFEQFATRIVYKVKHVATVPAEKENTDAEFGIVFVYGF